MAATYEPIATTTLGSAAANITFSSIPATYTDLRVVVVWFLSAAYNPSFRLNGLSTTIYSYTSLRGIGTSANSSTQRDFTKTEARLATGITTDNTQPAFVTIDIFNYTGSTNKIALCTLSNDYNSTLSLVSRDAALVQTTNAITSITLLADSVYGGNLNTGTIATLYGIKSA